MDPNPSIPFQVDQWIVDKKHPGQLGQYTGRWSKAGPHIMVELRYPNGGIARRPLSVLEPREQTSGFGSIKQCLADGLYGKKGDLRRLVTFEKLKGSLHEVIYSMEAAQVDFYPYQFKPVLKFIRSQTERLLLADEVGLGKTIESALIWMEVQARRDARRLLVISPKILTEKWRQELKDKFQIDARIIDFKSLRLELEELKRIGPSHRFALIGSYTGLRPPKDELDLLDIPPSDDNEGSPRTRLLRELRHWPDTYTPIDMVIFDEAHYMRNSGTTTFHLGESLAAHPEAAVLCVSATPVHNKSADLQSLLRLVDRDFFETQGMFQDLLEANRPAIDALNALSRAPLPMADLERSVERMANSKFIRESANFRRLLDLLSGMSSKDTARIAEAQDLVERLNLLGDYINRTRRVQVAERRAVRKPSVLEVSATEEEMLLYQAILKLVKSKCRLDKRRFHIFQVMGWQLRAASCLPVIAEEIKEGRLGELGDLMAEGFGEDLFEDLDDFGDEDPEMDFETLKALLDYDFEASDTKFSQLQDLLLRQMPDEKLVIFAYYRPTLAYLRRRLSSEGISVATIHGGVSHDDRWRELESFRDPKGPRVLLSSEVGSEGIDLQFCRIIANYDLPWNPMRVEQRIGRIDRVGQKADRLSIINFKVSGTIEERLYDRLHSKLILSSNSLGDLEPIIGETVKRLTVDLLSKELTEEEELQRIEQAERVIEREALEIRNLEESGEGLIALSDYVQRKIEENHEKGRYVQPDELEDYLSDFFNREFQGTEVLFNTPQQECLQVKLSPEARDSLKDFISDDPSLIARPFRQGQFSITFHRETAQALSQERRKRIHFVNHLSPLVRWITRSNQASEHSFYKVSALRLEDDFLDPGIYCYHVERWTLTGLTTRESMVYGVVRIGRQTAFDENQSEEIVSNLLRNGEDWEYPNVDTESLIAAYSLVEETVGERFSDAVERFEDDNQSLLQKKLHRVEKFFERTIESSEKALKTLIERKRGRGVIRATKGRIVREKENRDQRTKELKSKSEVDFRNSPIAAGIFEVVRKGEDLP